MNNLSPELEKILQTEPSAVQQVDCVCPQDKYYALLKIIRKTILQGNSNLLVIPDKDLLLVKNIIENSELKDLVLYVKNDVIEDAQSLLLDFSNDSVLANFEQLEYKVLRYHQERLKSNISNYYHAISTPIFGEKSISTLSPIAANAEQYHSSEYIRGRIDSSPFSFNYEEFWKIKNCIEEATLLYNSDFVGLNLLNPFSNSFISMIVEKNDLRQLNVILEDNLERTKILIGKYYHSMSEFPQERRIEIVNHLKEANKKYLELLDILNIDRLNLGNEKSTKKYFPFRKSKKNLHKYTEMYMALIDYFQEMQLISHSQYSILKTVNLDSDGIIQALADIKLLLDAESNEMEQIINLKARSVNVLNTNNPSLKYIESEFNALLLALNKTKFWKIVWENNALSIYTKIKNLENIYTHLLSSRLFLENNKDFLFWASFLNELDHKSRMVVESLRFLSTDKWLNAFISWYLNELIDINDSKYPIKSKLEEYIDNSSKIGEGEIVAYRSEQSAHLKSMISNSSNTDKKYMKSLTVREQINSSLAYHLGHSSYIIEKSPIVVIAQTDIAFLQPQILKNWKYLHFTTEKSPNFILDNSIILHYLEKNTIAGPSRKDNDCKFSINYLYKDFGQFSTLTPRQQLGPAKQLASQLYEFFPKINTFVQEKEYILSLVNTSKLNSYCLRNEIDKIRPYNISGNTLDNVTDIILECEDDYTLTILIENDIINPSRIEFLDWQLLVLQNMRNAGFQVVSIHTERKKTNSLKKQDLVNEAY